MRRVSGPRSPHHSGRAVFPHPAFGRDHAFAFGMGTDCRMRRRRPQSALRGNRATGRAWVYMRDDKPFGGPGSAGGSVPLLAGPLRRSRYENAAIDFCGRP